MRWLRANNRLMCHGAFNNSATRKRRISRHDDVLTWTFATNHHVFSWSKLLRKNLRPIIVIDPNNTHSRPSRSFDRFEPINPADP
jgi:hypothetical protein